MYLLYFVAGFILLSYGADYLVRGSSSMAVSFGVKKIVVGLTLVAFGTSMPEFVVSFFAALNRIDNISVGNIVGSNLANLLLILGLSALIRPFAIRKRLLVLEIPVLLLITLLFILFAHDGSLRAVEGLVMLVLFGIYLIYVIINRRIHNLTEVELIEFDVTHRLKNLLFSILGVIGLIIGGQLTVKGAVGLARALGISDLIIGLTIVAVGTSLPELFTSVVAVIKKEDEISIGNIIGSNLFNTAFVLGLIPIFYPLRIDAQVIHFDNFFMLSVTCLLALIVFISKKLTRFNGIMLISLYCFYILNLIFHFI